MKKKNYIRFFPDSTYIAYYMCNIVSLCVLLSMIILFFCTSDQKLKFTADMVGLFAAIMILVIDVGLIPQFRYYISISDNYIYNRHKCVCKFVTIQYKTKVNIKDIKNIDIISGTFDSNGRQIGMRIPRINYGNKAVFFYTIRCYFLITDIYDKKYRFYLDSYSVKKIRLILEDIKYQMKSQSNMHHINLDINKICEKYSITNENRIKNMEKIHVFAWKK